MAGSFTGTWVIEQTPEDLEESGAVGFDIDGTDAFEGTDEVPVTPLEAQALEVAAHIRRGHTDAALSAAVDLVNAMGAKYNTHAYAQR